MQYGNRGSIHEELHVIAVRTCEKALCCPVQTLRPLWDIIAAEHIEVNMVDEKLTMNIATWGVQVERKVSIACTKPGRVSNSLTCKTTTEACSSYFTL